MIGVVTGGTGYAGAIPEAQVAGKTGTAELGPGARARRTPNTRSRSRTPGSPPSPRPRSAKLAVGVLLIDAGAAGGEVAAPIASQVLSAGL